MRVVCEDEIVPFRRADMALRACFHQRLGLIWPSVIELGISPAVRVGVLLRVFYDELDICGWPSNEGLGLPEDCIVFV
jgi:hypothetical protein